MYDSSCHKFTWDQYRTSLAKQECILHPTKQERRGHIHRNLMSFIFMAQAAFINNNNQYYN